MSSRLHLGSWVLYLEFGNLKFYPPPFTWQVKLWTIITKLCDINNRERWRWERSPRGNGDGLVTILGSSQKSSSEWKWDYFLWNLSEHVKSINLLILLLPPPWPTSIPLLHIDCKLLCSAAHHFYHSACNLCILTYLQHCSDNLFAGCQNVFWYVMMMMTATTII